MTDMIQLKDSIQARHFEQVVQQSDAEKIGKLAKKCVLGLAKPESDQEAFNAFKQTENQNDPDVLCAIARAYQFGWGVEKDVINAVEYYVKAADAGSHEAMWRLRECKNSSVDSQLKAAFEHFKHLDGNGDTIAQTNLGCCYYYGIGTAIDDKLAAEIFQKAVNNGSSDAMSRLCILYKNGHGVEKNVCKAFELAQQSADAGNMNGQYHLGLLYQTGVGVDKNPSLAAFWFEKAAEQG